MTHQRKKDKYAKTKTTQLVESSKEQEKSTLGL